MERSSPPSNHGNSDLDEEDGDLTDMLIELRVLLPPARLPSAFLITVPFSAGFAAIVSSDKDVFLARGHV